MSIHKFGAIKSYNRAVRDHKVGSFYKHGYTGYYKINNKKLLSSDQTIYCDGHGRGFVMNETRAKHEFDKKDKLFMPLECFILEFLKTAHT